MSLKMPTLQQLISFTVIPTVLTTKCMHKLNFPLHPSYVPTLPENIITTKKFSQKKTINSIPLTELSQKMANIKTSITNLNFNRFWIFSRFGKQYQTEDPYVKRYIGLSFG